MLKMEKEDKLSYENTIEAVKKFGSSDSQPEASNCDQGVHADPKWTDYLLEKEEEDKPRMSLTERINVMLEKEKREREAAYSRGIPVLNTLGDGEPVVPVKVQEPSEEEIQAKHKAWKEKLDRATKDYEAKQKTLRREIDLEKEKQEKSLKDNLPRDYYWKPNLLFSLHLKELGYSKIAVDRALFSVNNESAKAALEYLKANPNPKELTKEDVMCVAEEALRNVKLERPKPDVGTESDEEDSHTTGNFNKDIQTVADKKGMKRNYDGKAVIPEKRTISEKNTIPKEETVSEKKKTIIVGKPHKYKLFLLSNVSLVMDAITLSLESSKVTVKIMDKLLQGDGELYKMRKEWEQNGNQMEMYRVRDSDCLRELQEEAETRGYINYMAERSQYVFEDPPSATVLGFIGESKHLHLLTRNLKLL